MLTYKAMYKYLDEGVHAEVLDFPGVITFGKDLEEARRMLSSALVDMAETNTLLNELTFQVSETWKVSHFYGGKIFPGFKTFSGSNACLMRCCSAIRVGSSAIGKYRARL